MVLIDIFNGVEVSSAGLRSRFGSAVVGGLRALVRSVSAKVGSGLRLMFASVEVSVVFINIAQRVFLSALFLVFCEAK